MEICKQNINSEENGFRRECTLRKRILLPRREEEETPNETTALKYEEVEQDRQLSKIQDFIHSRRPRNTETKDDLRSEHLAKILFLSCRDKNLGKHPPNELNILLCRFFKDVRKKDGGVFEPGTLAPLLER